MSTVSVLGAGYIGYPLALMLASKGHAVVAVDTNPEVADAIRLGIPLSTEPDVAQLAADPVVIANLTAATASNPSDIFIIAVPTPYDYQFRRAELAFLEVATRSIVSHISPGALVIVESTVPPGTTDGLVASILAESGLAIGDEILLAHCPERLHPGSTLRELTENDRIVGGVSAASSRAGRELYSSFVTGEILIATALEAELCKLLENTYRDVNLALANQMATLVEELGADAEQVLTLASRHPRVSYLNSGIGVGGHCIPVDPWFLHDAAPHAAGLISQARQANLNRERLTSQRIAKEMRDLGGSIVVLAGLAYKANVPDIRESPAVRIGEELASEGFEVRIYDPLALPDRTDVLSVAKDADLLAILVPHDMMMQEIAAKEVELRKAMARPNLRDYSRGMGRDIFSRS